MRLLTTFIGSLLLFLSCSGAFAQPVKVPPLNQRVTDLTHTLSAQDVASLTQKLEALEKEKGSQIAVLMIPTTGEESIEQFGIRVVDEWKLGRKDASDGVLLLVAKNDKKIRIEVGRGLEGALPDVIAARIIRELITPAFSRGAYMEGIDHAVDKISSIIQGEELPPISEENEQLNYSDNQIFGLPFLFWIGIVIGGLILSKIAGGWIGRGGAGIITIIATALTGTSIAISLIIGLVVAIMISILGTRIFWDILSLVLQSGGGRGGGSGGGFSGGGGGFSGGGASGDW